jgi:hypothetical protein
MFLWATPKRVSKLRGLGKFNPSPSQWVGMELATSVWNDTIAFILALPESWQIVGKSLFDG